MTDTVKPMSEGEAGETPAKVASPVGEVMRPKEIFRDIASPACSDVSEINMFAEEEAMKARDGIYPGSRPQTPGTPNIPEVLSDHWENAKPGTGEIQEAGIGGDTWARQQAERESLKEDSAGEMNAEDMHVCEISDTDVFSSFKENAGVAPPKKQNKA